MRYDNSDILQDSSTGKKYFSNIIYPQITPKDTDIYVITNIGDRLDILANDYYKDSTLWWVIAACNDIRQDSIFIEPGTQLRIPTDLVEFDNEFNQVNKDR